MLRGAAKVTEHSHFTSNGGTSHLEMCDDCCSMFFFPSFSQAWPN